MVSTHLKNISQNGNLPQMGVKIKNIWNHHPEDLSITPWYCMVGPWSSPVSPRHTTCLRYSSTATTGQPLSKAWVCLQKGKPKHKLHCFKIHKKKSRHKSFQCCQKRPSHQKKDTHWTWSESGVDIISLWMSSYGFHFLETWHMPQHYTSHFMGQGTSGLYVRYQS